MNLPRPPRWMMKLTEWYCHPDYLQEVQGDLHELFLEWSEHKGLRRAKVLYLLHSILFMRAYNSKFSYETMNSQRLLMLGHFAKIFSRNFVKHKWLNLANLIGLVSGIAVSLVMLLHVKYETSYELDYPKSERIVRMSLSEDWAKSSPMFAEEFKSFYSQTEAVGRFAQYSSGEVIIEAGQKQFISDQLLLSDQSNLDIFDLKFEAGNREGALIRPYTVVLTTSLAQKIYGNKSPIGETLKLNGTTNFEITGVIEDLPERSHIKAELLISMPTFYDYVESSWLESKSWMVMYTYALLNETEDIPEIRAQLKDFFVHYLPEEMREEVGESEGRFGLMPLQDIHLHSDKIQEMSKNSDVLYVYVFASLASIIIVIASVNFINIFTALIFDRSREIGLRKSIGATKGQVTFQILMEAVFYVLLALTLGILLCLVLLPYYNSISGSDLSIGQLLNIKDYMSVLGFGLGLGLLSGIYPAWLIWKIRLTSSQSSALDAGLKVSNLRKGLIVFQFFLSLFVLTATLAINKQMSFVMNADVGYTADNVVTIPVNGEFKSALKEGRQEIYNRFLALPGVTAVSTTSTLIGESMSVEGYKLASASPDDDHPSVNFMWTDEHYLSLMDIEISAGRNFDSRSDTSVAFIVNRSLANMVGRDPLGEVIQFRGQNGVVVGIVDDYNYYSLHNDIKPMVLCYKPGWTSKLLIRIDETDRISSLQAIENEIRSIDANFLFYPMYLEEQISTLYQNEHIMYTVFQIFSFLALLISCVGLLGLAAMELRRRTKELGIRRVLGAGIYQVLLLLASQFLGMLVIAIFLGLPLSYFVVQEWMNDFSYSSGVDIFIFATPVLILLISIVVLIYSCVLVNGRKNPVYALRSE